MKKFTLLPILLFTVLQLSAQWTQVGPDIDGNAFDNFGYSLDLSSDGLTFVGGSPYSDEFAVDAGKVSVYSYDGASWNQKGNVIYGEYIEQSLGATVRLDSSGNTLAISGLKNPGGFVQDSSYIFVYQYNAGIWEQMGPRFEHKSKLNVLTKPIDLSSDGRTIVIGSEVSNSCSGSVRVYDYNDTVWVQRGNSIAAEDWGDNLGESVSINAEGNIIAAGAPNNDGNGDHSGHVRLYEYGESDWVQLGSDIDGEEAGNVLGTAISLSSDGYTVALGSHVNNGNGLASGHVRIFNYNGTEWVQKGSDIDGEAADDRSGGAVSLSDDGNIVAIGACKNGGQRGHVRIFEYNGTDWIQSGSDIDGEGPNDFSGTSVNISADGSYVAIGAQSNGGGGTVAGHVRVFNLKSVGIENREVHQVRVYPNPSQGIVHISDDNLVKIELLNSNGQIILQKEACRSLDLSMLSKGIYFIKMIGSEHTLIEKILLN